MSRKRFTKESTIAHGFVCSIIRLNRIFKKETDIKISLSGERKKKFISSIYVKMIN